MDLTLRAAAKTSAASGAPIAPGAQLTSFLVVGADGELERFDLLANEAADWTPPGPVAARWKRRVPEKDETAAQAKQRAMSDAEALFRALGDGAEEAPDETDFAALNPDDRAALRYLISLHLERGRQLRAAPGSPRRLIHAQTKETFIVPPVELSPAHFGRFSQLVTGV